MKSIPSLRRTCSGVLFVLALLAANLPAAAQQLLQFSETEKAGFAFHTLSDTKPDFQSWIVSSERYLALKPRGKIVLLQSELQRLNNGFINYQRDVDLIVLNLAATIESSQFFEQSQLSDKPTNITIRLKDLPENYFPFQIGKLWVAVVIKDFDSVSSMKMDREQYKDFVDTFKLKTAAYQSKQDVNVDLKLRPLSVDMSEPMMIDGFEMWLMLAEIADMQFWRKSSGGTKELLWHYSAPWYVSEDHKDILRLYSR